MRLKSPNARMMSLVVIVAVGFVVARRWSRGTSIFGFESPYWDLGLIPILIALVIGACRLGGADPRTRRFLLGFEVFGWAAVVAYTLSCSRPAMWSPVSALLPFQTGYMLAPRYGASWRSLHFGGVLVDTAILVALPFIVAAVGGVMFSVRFTMRRIAVAVAVIAVVLGAFVGVVRRIRRFDSLSAYHRDQIVGAVTVENGPDGEMRYIALSVGRNRKPLPPGQQALDRWHARMAGKYRRAARYPWLSVSPEPPE